MFAMVFLGNFCTFQLSCCNLPFISTTSSFSSLETNFRFLIFWGLILVSLQNNLGFQKYLSCSYKLQLLPYFAYFCIVTLIYSKFALCIKMCPSYFKGLCNPSILRLNWDIACTFIFHRLALMVNRILWESLRLK